MNSFDSNQNQEAASTKIKNKAELLKKLTSTSDGSQSDSSDSTFVIVNPRSSDRRVKLSDPLDRIHDFDADILDTYSTSTGTMNYDDDSIVSVESAKLLSKYKDYRKCVPMEKPQVAKVVQLLNDSDVLTHLDFVSVEEFRRLVDADGDELSMDNSCYQLLPNAPPGPMERDMIKQTILDTLEAYWRETGNVELTMNMKRTNGQQELNIKLNKNFSPMQEKVVAPSKPAAAPSDWSLTAYDFLGSNARKIPTRYYRKKSNGSPKSKKNKK